MWNRELLYKKEDRRNRKHNIWVVLRYIAAYNDLVDSSDFYSFQNNLTEYENAREELGKYSPNDYSFRVAFRFCRTEYYSGACDKELTDKDIRDVLNWHTNTIDKYKIAESVLNSYKDYWDGVLASYKRPSARIKRLHYLVENLEDVSKLPFIQEYPDILSRVKDLQGLYSSQLQYPPDTP